VIRFPPPEPVSPAPEAAYYYRTEPPELRFQWEAPDEVLYYVLEAADNPAMTNPALRAEVRYNSLVYSSLAEGRWYWRVTPVFSAVYRGNVPVSPVIPFTVIRGDPPVVETAAESSLAEEPAAVEIVEPPPLPKPAAVAAESRPQPRRENAESRLPAASGREPESGYVINRAALLESRAIVFSWNPVAGADAYVFTLFHEIAPGERRPVISSEGPATSYTLNNLSLLDLGRFVWQVEAVTRGTDGGRRGIPGENLFTVDIPLPDTPQARDPGILYGR
jgi:hypothetical protein